MAEATPTRRLHHFNRHRRLLNRIRLYRRRRYPIRPQIRILFQMEIETKNNKI